MIFDDNEIRTASRDLLNREPVARALVEMLNSPGVETPLTFGILGGWGTGKSSLMHMMKEKIMHLAPQMRPPNTEDVFVWFDTWAYARQEQSLWRALLLAVVEQLKGKSGLGKANASDDEVADWNEELRTLETSLYKAQTLSSKGDLRVNWGNAVPLAADLALRYATAGISDTASDGGFFKRLVNGLKGEDAKEAMTLIEREAEETYVSEVKALDDFRAAFRSILQRANIDRAKRRLVVFVDDLDRCLPEDAVAAIEAIKLFLYENGCVFILGMDPAVVERGIGVRYQNTKRLNEHGEAELPFDPADYLDKVIQVPFRIPPLGPDQVRSLLSNLQAQDTNNVISSTTELLVETVPPNPRTLKRVLNVLLLFHKLQPHLSADPRQTALLGKLVLLQVLFRPAYQLLYENDGEVLKQLENRGTRSNIVPENVLSLPGLKDMMQAEGGYYFADSDNTEIEMLINMVESTSTSSKTRT